MFSLDPSRMYAALRCIESELEKPRPSMKRIREIMAEASRELRPTTGAVDGAIVYPSDDASRVVFRVDGGSRTIPHRH